MANNNNKTLEQLMSEASEISDARKKVFNELCRSIGMKLIPALSKIMKSYDKNKCFFSLNSKPIAGFKGYGNPESEKTEYGLCVNSDGSICECAWNYFEQSWGCESDNMESFEILRIGAIELANEILDRIISLNSKNQGENSDAQYLVDAIKAFNN